MARFVLVTCSGDDFLRFEYAACRYLDYYSVQFQLAVTWIAARQLYIPSHFINITLPCAIDCERNNYIQVVQSPPTFDFIHAVSERHRVSCLVCGDIPDAAGVSCRWFQREEACVECSPDDVCERCRVGTNQSDGSQRTFRCLACVTEEDIQQGRVTLSDKKRKRLKALESYWELSDGPSICLRSTHILWPGGRI